jgi:membrane-associated phospholipid phosphatase
VSAAARTRFPFASPATWLVPLVTLIAFVLVAGSGRNLQLFLLLNAVGPETSDWLWANVTVLGDTVVALALCLPLWRRRPDLLWALALGGLFATAWVHGLKPWLDIARPPAVLGDAVHVIGPTHTTRSFPSGHATTAFLVAGLIALGLASRLAFAAALLLVAFAAAASRSVVGVHWPLDVLGGAFGGWLAAVAGLALSQRFQAPTRSPWVQWLLGLILAGCAVALLAGYDGGYRQADWFLRGIGVAVLVAAGLALWRGRSAGHYP